MKSYSFARYIVVVAVSVNLSPEVFAYADMYVGFMPLLKKLYRC